MSAAHKADRAKALAREAGFDAAGIVRAGALPHSPERLRSYLDAGRHGDMGWMEARADERADPKKLWPETRSILMVGLNYGPAADPLEALAHKERGAISVYAQGRDYHDVVKKKLKSLGRALASEFRCALKVFVDTAPVMEKPLAAAAGLGWQGKHTNLVSRDYGSWFFLGAVYLPIDLEADDAGANHCGQCRRCLDICPTGAFPAPYELDARRCISYLTIELKGPIPRAFRRKMGNRIYGCDDCLAVCPWNKFASVARDAALHARAELAGAKLGELAALDDAAFRKLFAGSPVKRTGRDRFLRNILVAIGNSGDRRFGAVALERAGDASPLVRGAAVWALAQLMEPAEFSRLRDENAGRENDPGVREEWRLGAAD